MVTFCVPVCYNGVAMKPVIAFDHVSKQFTLHRERPRSLQDLALSVLRRDRDRAEAFWALRDATFAVTRGQMLGIIGPNGAGKSTILKLITRILEPTSGVIHVDGRVAALLELGTGFHADLTGRENVYLNGSLLGFSRRHMDERLGSIIEFAEMQRFIDIPVRHYSSGMYMRLGFAIAVHADPDILITDEVLAVGDEAFQNKCLDRMRRFREAGTTIILVSHNLPMVRRLCDRVIWLKQGTIVLDGPADMVVDAYLAEVTGAEKEAQAQGLRPWDSGAIAAALDDTAPMRLLGVAMVGQDGQPRWDVQAGEKMSLHVQYEARRDVPNAVVSVQVFDREDQSFICGCNSYADGLSLSVREGRGSLVYPDLVLPLRRGAYLLSVALYGDPDPPAWANPVDMRHKAYTLTVDSPMAGPHRRWGSGEVLVDAVRLCGRDGRERSEFRVGESLSLHVRCTAQGAPVDDPIVRVQILRASDGLLCHGTNTARQGARLGWLAGSRHVVLMYERLDLLEGSYLVSVGAWPDEEAIRPYDLHDAAYRLTVRSGRAEGAGIVALPHTWNIGD